MDWEERCGGVLKSWRRELEEVKEKILFVQSFEDILFIFSSAVHFITKYHSFKYLNKINKCKNIFDLATIFSNMSSLTN